QAVAIGIGARQPRSDLRAIDRLRHDAEGILQYGKVEPCEMKELGDLPVLQDPGQVWRLLLARSDLDDIRRAVARRKLNHAKSIPMRHQSLCLGVDGDRVDFVTVEGRQVM